MFLIIPIGLMGWILGYIKEAAGNGSSIPGWVAHGLGDTVAFSSLAFLWKCVFGSWK